MVKRIFAVVLAALMLTFTSIPVLAEETVALFVEVTTGAETGTVSPGNSVYQNGDAVTFNIRPKEGYVLSKFTVNGTEVKVENNRYTHVMDSITVVKAEFVTGVKITVTQPTGGKITPAGTASVLYALPGSDCEFAFTANEGYKLKAITLNGVSVPYSQANYSLKVEEGKEYTVSAEFEEVKTYSVTFNVSGFGSVIPNPTDNKLFVEEGKDLVFSLLPDEGNGVESVMMGETALIPDKEGKYTISALSEDKVVDIKFAQRKLCDVVVTYTEGGTVSPETTQALEGETLVFTLTPNEGYEIESFTVNGVVVELAEDNTASVVITGNMTVIATFRAIVPTHLITAYVKNNVGGTITAEGYTIEQMKVYVQEGESITFVFTPDMDYEISNVKVDARDVTIVNNTFTFSNVTAAHNIVVTFTIKEHQTTTLYTVKPYAGSNGTISPSVEQSLEAGKSVTFTFTPDAGYEINYVMVDNVDVAVTDGKYTISNISKNHTIEVYFKKKAVVVKDTVTAEDIDWKANPIVIDITNYKKVDSEVFSKIRTDYANVPYKVTCADYEWYFPAGVKLFPLSSTVDFTVTVNGGTNYAAIKALLDKRLSDSNLGALENVLLSVNLNATADLGATLKFKLGSTFANMKLDYLEPNVEEETIKSIINNINKTLTDDQKYTELTVTAAADGFVTVPFANTANMLLVRAVEGTYTVFADCGSNGSIAPRGDYPVKAGSDKEYLINADLGYVIDEVYVDGVLVPDFTGKASATYKFEQVTAEHTITVTFKYNTEISKDTSDDVSDSDSSDDSSAGEKSGGAKTWLIAIIIVAVSLIGAGVLFIYKWQQEKDIIE